MATDPWAVVSGEGAAPNEAAAAPPVDHSDPWAVVSGPTPHDGQESGPWQKYQSQQPDSQESGPWDQYKGPGAPKDPWAVVSGPPKHDPAVLQRYITDTAMHGRPGSLPQPEDFDHAASLLAPGRADTVAKKLRAIYAATGKPPADVALDALHNAGIRQDLLATNRTIPDAYSAPGTAPITDKFSNENTPSLGHINDATREAIGYLITGQVPMPPTVADAKTAPPGGPSLQEMAQPKKQPEQTGYAPPSSEKWFGFYAPWVNLGYAGAKGNSVIARLAANILYLANSSRDQLREQIRSQIGDPPGDLTLDGVTMHWVSNPTTGALTLAQGESPAYQRNDWLTKAEDWLNRYAENIAPASPTKNAHGVQKFTGQVYQGVGELPVNLMKYAIGVRLLGPMLGFGAPDALQEANHGPRAALEAGAKGMIMGSIFEGANGLHLPLRAGVLAAAGGATAAMDHGDAADIIANATTMALLSGLAPTEGTRLRDLYRSAPTRAQLGYGALPRTSADDLMALTSVQDTTMSPAEVLSYATDVPRRSAQDMVEMTKRIQAEGVKPAIIIEHPNGQRETVDTHHGAEIAKELGMDRMPVKIVRASGMGKALLLQRDAKVPQSSDAPGLELSPDEYPLDLKLSERALFEMADQAYTKDPARTAEVLQSDMSDAEAAREFGYIIRGNGNGRGTESSPAANAGEVAGERSQGAPTEKGRVGPGNAEAAAGSGGGKPAPEGGGSGNLTAAQRAILDRIGEPSKPNGGLLNTWDKIYTNVYNDLHPLAVISRAITGGENLPAHIDPEKLGRLEKVATTKVESWLTRATFFFKTYKDNGPSYREIIKPVKDNLDAFRALLLARHALEVKTETGIPLEAAREVVDAATPEQLKAADQFTAYRDRLLQYLVDSGVVGKDAAEAMREAYRHYVPLKRVFDTEGPTGTGKGVRNPIKGRKGSERQILDPLEETVRDTHIAIALAERNAVREALVSLAEQYGRSDLVTPQRVKLKPTTASVEEVRRLLKEYGVENVDPKPLTIFRPGALRLAKDEFVVYRDGKPKVYKADPYVIKALDGSDQVTMKWLLKIAKAPATALKAGIVVTPDFIVKNVLRDAFTAFVYTGAHPGDTLRGARSLKAKDDWFADFQKSGGGMASIYALDKEYIQRHVFKLDNETHLLRSTWNIIRTPYDALAVLAELSDNATRLGAFRKDIEQHGGGRTKADLQRAAIASRDSTVDFFRAGAKVRAIHGITAFMNVGLQGPERMVRAFKEHPARATFRALATITLPSVLLYLANRNDPRYKALPQWQKDMFWIILTKDHIYRIPKPQELGLVFGTLAERITGWLLDRDPHAFDHLTQSVANQYVPNLVPTIAVPVLEQYFNKSFFTGNPLIPSSMENILPPYQVNDYSSQTAKDIGRMIGTLPGVDQMSISSPIVIDNYVRAWSGSLGVYAVQALDQALIHIGPKGNRPPVKPAATLSDIPFAKSFAVRFPALNAQPIEDFYSRYGVQNKAYTTIRQLAEQGDIDAARRLMELHPDAMTRLQSVAKALSNQRRAIHLIYQNRTFTADDKRQMIDMLLYEMIKESEMANKLMDQQDKILETRTH